MTMIEVAKLQPENQQQVQKFLDEILKRFRLPGISVAMNVNGDTLEVTAGVSDAELNHPMNSGMHFELGCINNFLVSIVVLELFNKKLIDIERAISHYLPELVGRNGDIIKIRHLLSHTAGYQGENLADPDTAQDYTWQEFAVGFNERLMLFNPGTVFNYSHSATVILGRVIEIITQHELLELIKDLVFEPLSIRVINDSHAQSLTCVSGHQLNPLTAQLEKPMRVELSEFWSTSLSGLWITMRDLVKIGGAIVGSSPIFSSTTKELLLVDAVKLPGLFVGKMAEHPYYLFGLGCAHFPNGSYGVRTNSTDQCCALRFDKENKLVIAVGINTSAAYTRDFIIDKLFNAMLPADAPLISEFHPLPQTKLEMGELVGTYNGPENSSINVCLEDEQLALRIGHNPGITLDTKKIIFKWEKDDHGCITPLNNSFQIPIGFFRDGVSKSVGLMVGVNAFKKCEINHS